MSTPKVVPYRTGPHHKPREGVLRTANLKNGARIEIFRFTQPDKEGEYGMNVRFFSSPKAGKRTLLKFTLTDEAAAQTCAMLSEFFGICTCA